jgi:hypothetical protein
MPDDFDQPTSGSEKNRRCSHANEQREFSAHDARGILGISVRFRLCRHGREHIEFASAMQSVRTRSEYVGSQRFEPSIAHLLTPLRRGGEQVSVAFSASARTNEALNGLRCIVSAEAVQVAAH